MTSLNFDTYELLRLAEMPKVETVIVPTNDFWGGVGEPTICVVAPAVHQCDPRGNRQAGAQPAAQERQARLTGGGSGATTLERSRACSALERSAFQRYDR